MKHILSIIVLSLMTVSVMAVQYPKKPYTGGGTTSHAPVTYQQQAGQKHGYVTPTTGSSSYSGSVTIVGATTPTSSLPSTSHGGPRRTGQLNGEDYGGTLSEDGLPVGVFSDGATYTDEKGVVYVYYTSSGWMTQSNSGNSQGSADAENQIPLGSTWVMLLFAAFFALSIRLRRRPQA